MTMEEETMSSVQIVHERLSDQDRGDLLFGGALLVFPRVPSLGAFRERVADLIHEQFADVDPLTAQDSMDPEELDSVIGALRGKVGHDDMVRQHALAALAETGVDLGDTYWDKVNLRMLPSGGGHAKRGTGWHRDTWGSNVDAQMNWWTPIFPITVDRTISFAPDRWNRAVANSSSRWSPAAARQQVVPPIPEPEEAISGLAELPVVIEPGDFLCFSAAQLHRSVPNRTGVTRFSVEVRTVFGVDVRTGRGAPNVDSRTPDSHYRWFRHVGNGRPLQAPA